MRRLDWYLLAAGPTLLGLAVMGCSEGRSPKHAAAGTTPRPQMTVQTPANTDSKSAEPAATELADARDTIELSVPGMH